MKKRVVSRRARALRYGRPMKVKTWMTRRGRVIKLSAGLSQRGRNLRLQLFEDVDFEGRRIVFEGGEVAVRDLRILSFNDALSSFRVRNSDQRNQVTLVLFEDINYQGDFKVYRGSQNVDNLVDKDFNDEASSFVLVARRLNNDQVRRIRDRRRPPGGVLEIRN